MSINHLKTSSCCNAAICSNILLTSFSKKKTRARTCAPDQFGRRPAWLLPEAANSELVTRMSIKVPHRTPNGQSLTRKQHERNTPCCHRTFKPHAFVLVVSGSSAAAPQILTLVFGTARQLVCSLSQGTSSSSTRATVRTTDSRWTSSRMRSRGGMCTTAVHRWWTNIRKTARRFMAAGHRGRGRPADTGTYVHIVQERFWCATTKTFGLPRRRALLTIARSQSARQHSGC